MKKAWRIFTSTLAWILYSRYWCQRDIEYQHAQRKGMRCLSSDDHLLWITNRYDPTLPPQPKPPKFIWLREWVRRDLIDFDMKPIHKEP